MRTSGPDGSLRFTRDDAGGSYPCYLCFSPSTCHEGIFVLVWYFSGVLVIICSLGLFWECHCARGGWSFLMIRV